MQNLKNQPSASDSAKTEPESDQLNGTFTPHMAEVPDISSAENNPSTETSTASNNVAQERLVDSSADVEINENTVDNITEPDFMSRIDPNGNLKPEEKAFIPLPTPQDSTVQEPIHRSRSLRLQWRFFRTLIFAAWIFARLIFWQIYVRRFVPGWVDRSNLKRWQLYARQYSRFAASMGGVFIKLGQFISTRVDILPEEIVRELEGLQDEVPRIAFSKIESVVISELGPINNRFESFNEEPIAAASLGQVHRAKLKNGDRVVVKVQRPDIREICYTDLAAMRVVARVAMRFNFISRRSDAVALVEEFGRVLLEELSYKHEAYNAMRFMEMFKNNMDVYIPAVYNEHSTDQVLTLEDVTTIKINDYEALENAGINRLAVAQRLMETYLSQVFDFYYFHADPHPGNLFIYPLPVEDENADFGLNGRPFYLIFIDFGMTATLTKDIADGMVSTLHAVLTRDPKRLVASYVALGFILPGADIPRIEEAVKSVFDKVWGMSMSQIRDMDYESVVDIADEFTDLMLSMPFYIPQDFIYLGRTLSILSGIATSLDPMFNPWQELQPHAEKLIAQGFGIDMPSQGSSTAALGVSVIQNLLSGNGAEVVRTVGQEVVRRAMPPQLNRADEALQRLKDGDIHIVAELSLAHRQQLRRIERESKRTGRAVFFGSVLIASTLLYTNGETSLAIAGLIVCGLTVVIGFFQDT